MNKLTQEQLNEIEERAKNAPCGPYVEHEDYDYYQGGTYLKSGEQDVCRIHDTQYGEFALSVDPTIVLSMVAELKALRESEAALAHDFNGLTSRVMSLSKQLNEAKELIDYYAYTLEQGEKDALIYLKKWYPGEYK